MKKIFLVVLSLITAVSLSICSFAFEGELTAALFIETADGSLFTSNEVVINDSASEYTFTLSGINASNPAMIYIKDINLSDTVNTSSFDMQVLIADFKVNGESVSLSPDYRTLPNAEMFDFCYYNVNGFSAFELSDATVTDVELVINVTPTDKPADTGITLGTVSLVMALAFTALLKKR